jgi:hypothetical protein
MTPFEEFAIDARAWARQTIVFTLQYSLSDAKDGAEEEASNESVEITNRLWSMAEKGSDEPTQIVRQYLAGARLGLAESSRVNEREIQFEAVKGQV